MRERRTLSRLLSFACMADFISFLLMKYPVIDLEWAVEKVEKFSIAYLILSSNGGAVDVVVDPIL